MAVGGTDLSKLNKTDVVDSLATVVKSLIDDPMLSRSESQIRGTDLRVAGYRMSKPPFILRIDVKEFNDFNNKD